MQLLSAFGGGLWAIPSAVALAGLWLISRGIRAHNSGSKQQSEKGWDVSEKKVPLFKIPQFFLGVALIIVAIAITIYMHSER